MTRRWAAWAGLGFAFGLVAALALDGCGNCGTGGDVCGSDGYLRPTCSVPFGITALPDECCRFGDGGLADTPPADGTPRSLCDAPAQCRPNQPGACIPPGSTLLPDGGIVLADGGAYQVADGG